MSETELPILYSFRRCPYAMRARMALAKSGQTCRVREVVLRDKPEHMVKISPKATVPVLQLPDGTVLEESLDVMQWALGSNDPDNWMHPETGSTGEMMDLIADCDGDFKHHLDRYKYANRYEGADPAVHRDGGEVFLKRLNERLLDQPYLFGNRACLADQAIAPFVRQFANTDRAWFDAQPLSGLQAWLERFLASDLFTGIMEKLPQWKPGDEDTLRF